MTRVAVLDDAGRLVGVASSGEGSLGQRVLNGVNPGDLPLDGSYRWSEEGRQFVPAASRRPSASADDALFALAYDYVSKEDDTGRGVPSALRDWLEGEMKRRGGR